MKKIIRENKPNPKSCTKRTKDSESTSEEESHEVFSQEDEEKIKERLKNLGYM